MARVNGLLMVGVVLAILGIVGLAIPVFTTQKTEEVAHVGDLKIQSSEDISHRIPPLLSGGVLLLGVVLIGAGAYRKGYS